MLGHSFGMSMSRALNRHTAGRKIRSCVFVKGRRLKASRNRRTTRRVLFLLCLFWIYMTCFLLWSPTPATSYGANCDRASYPAFPWMTDPTPDAQCFWFAASKAANQMRHALNGNGGGGTNPNKGKGRGKGRSGLPSNQATEQIHEVAFDPNIDIRKAVEAVLPETARLRALLLRSGQYRRVHARR